MAVPKKLFDVWFVGKNSVFKEVPFNVVLEWVEKSRVDVDDQIKPSGTPKWFKIGQVKLFQPYFPVLEQTVAMTPEQAPTPTLSREPEQAGPIELDFNWKRRPDDDDDDVDMIPLIDISLVLLIFFMMTTIVAPISRVSSLPGVEHVSKVPPDTKILRIEIESKAGVPLYAVATGDAGAQPEDADLPDEAQLAQRLDAALNVLTRTPTVLIAAHSDLEYSTVESVMKALDVRRENGLIENYFVEVNEKPR